MRKRKIYEDVSPDGKSIPKTLGIENRDELEFSLRDKGKVNSRKRGFR